jgi:hypothetical protein
MRPSVARMLIVSYAQAAKRISLVELVHVLETADQRRNVLLPHDSTDGGMNETRLAIFSVDSQESCVEHFRPRDHVNIDEERVDVKDRGK